MEYNEIGMRGIDDDDIEFSIICNVLDNGFRLHECTNALTINKVDCHIGIYILCVSEVYLTNKI